jgi:hypothetical protein
LRLLEKQACPAAVAAAEGHTPKSLERIRDTRGIPPTSLQNERFLVMCTGERQVNVQSCKRRDTEESGPPPIVACRASGGQPRLKCGKYSGSIDPDVFNISPEFVTRATLHKTIARCSDDPPAMVRACRSTFRASASWPLAPT